MMKYEYCRVCSKKPIAESPPNPTIQLLNSQPEFSLSYLGEMSNRQRGPFPPPFGFDKIPMQHRTNVRYNQSRPILMKRDKIQT